MEQAGYTCMDGTRQSGNNVFLGTSACGQPLVAYSNQRTDDYLTPTSPASDQPPPLLSFPASFGRSQSQPHGVLGSKALTPTGSVPDQPPLLPSLPAGLGRSQSQPHGPQSNNSHHPFQSFPRADSGKSVLGCHFLVCVCVCVTVCACVCVLHASCLQVEVSHHESCILCECVFTSCVIQGCLLLLLLFACSHRYKFVAVSVGIYD